MPSPEATSRNDERSDEAFIALVRLLARQAAQECLNGLAEQDEQAEQPPSPISTEQLRG